MKVLTYMYHFASFESRMSAQSPWYHWDADVYEETIQVQVFRKYLSLLGQDLFDRYGGLRPASLVEVLSAGDVMRFRDRLTEAWQELQQMPSVIPCNKRLYDEMSRTRRSIEDYLTALQTDRAKLRPLPPLVLGFNRDRRIQLAQQMAGFGSEINPRFPSDHLNDFQRVSKFVTSIKAAFPGAVRGHLQWLAQHSDGTPQCVLLLFVSEGSRLEVRDLLRLWADLILTRQSNFSSSDVFGIGCEVEQTLSLTGSAAEVWEDVRQWLIKMFVDPLTYQRLKLPPGRRGWSKGRL